jgi:hypothetical protein
MFDSKIGILAKKLEEAELKFEAQEEENKLRLGYVAG